MAADEIQTGFGRTGHLMAYEHDQVKPDMVVLGKSISGGFMPVSGCVANDHIMQHIKPGDHGCTYGGNPLAMATSHAAVKCLIEEGMIENSAKMGALLLAELKKINSPVMKEIRGRGLFLGLEIKAEEGVKVDSGNLVNHLRNNGVLSVKAKSQTARLMPALVINES